MSVFTILRTVFLALFILINGAILATAAVNLTSSGPTEPLRPVDAYLIFSSASSILFLFPVILIDLVRRGALTSKVWFECLWLLVAWIMNLCGAAAVTALNPNPTCMAGALSWCSSGEALLGITWAGTLLVFAQLVLMVASSIYYCKRHPNIWSANVRDFQWFNGGGSGKSTVLHSAPPSPAFVPKQFTLEANPVPHLEYMASNWRPTPPPKDRKAPEAKPLQAMTVVVGPQPLSYAYAPEIPPARAPVHYSASATVSVGVLPGRRLSKKAQTAPSLYPTSVQVALNATSPKRSSTGPQTPPRQPIVSSAIPKVAAQPVSDEPLPIRDWPRRNPQEPRRKERSRAAPVAAAVIVPTSAPGPAPTTVPSSTDRSRGSPRRRPPPLDLTAASPSRIR